MAERVMPFELWRVASCRVLFVMAAKAEYGAMLQARIVPLVTGVGPIEAAVGTSAALARLHATGDRPDLVVSLGSAGSRTLAQGCVFQVESVSWRDMDASPLGFAPGRTPFLDLDPVQALPTPLPSLPRARLSTGADIVSGGRYDAIDADMVDMETFAVLRACQQHDVPMIGFRGISDGAAELRRTEDWTALLPIVDRELAIAVDALADALRAGWRPDGSPFSDASFVAAS